MIVCEVISHSGQFRKTSKMCKDHFVIQISFDYISESLKIRQIHFRNMFEYSYQYSLDVMMTSETRNVAIFHLVL